MLKFLILFILCTQSFAGIAFLEMDAPENINTDIKKSKFLIDFGMRYIDYPAPMAAFKGQHAKVESEEVFHTFNVNLGVGGEIFVAGAFSTTIKGSAYFSSNTSSKVGNAGEDLDLELSRMDNKYDIFGAEASISINYLFENKVVHIQPFIEAGFGKGKATLEKKFNDLGVTSTPATAYDYTEQTYEGKVEDDFTYANISLGVNFISNYNVSSYIKLTQNSVSVNDRTSSYTSKKYGATTNHPSADTEDSFSYLSASLGILYNF